MPRTLDRSAAVALGIILIIAPLVGVAIKLLSAGWLLVVLLIAAPVLLIGYVLQIVIAATGYLSTRAVLTTASRARRTAAAAWATSTAFVVTCLFVVDGGDESWGSSFMYLVGLASDTVASDVSTVIAIVSGVVWVGSWGWLVTEWIIALVARRRTRHRALTRSAPAGW